jgi:hypothetical protein
MTTTIDRERLRRAVHLPDPVRTADFSWRVGSEHIVSPLEEPGKRCTCSDCLYRPQVVCKHQIALQLFEGLGPELLAVLRELVPPPREGR